MTSAQAASSVFILHVHLVFVTKYRHQVFDSGHLERLEQIMRDVCTDFGAELREFNGEAEHVHLLVNSPPTVAISPRPPSPARKPAHQWSFG
jgi:putative transposase